MRNLLSVGMLVILAALVACDANQKVTTPATAEAPTQRLEASAYVPEFAPLTPAVAITPSMGACSITDNGVNTWTLDADCTTTTSVIVPDGYRLNLNGNTIEGTGDFQGAIVRNAGTSMHVMRGKITASATGCEGGAERLRGVMFEGASGSVSRLAITNIHRGPNGCQEGNGIEVRNAPFDGTHPNPQRVTIRGNRIADYQKTGIVANGDVIARIELNLIGESAAQSVLAANSVQLGFGATGAVRGNKIDGNQWLGTSNFAGSAVLVYEADGVEVKHNRIRGNSGIGLFIVADNGDYEHNDIRDVGADAPTSDFDAGIWDFGSGNTFKFNIVCGFEDSFIPDPLPGRFNRESCGFGFGR